MLSSLENFKSSRDGSPGQICCLCSAHVIFVAARALQIPHTCPAGHLHPGSGGDCYKSSLSWITPLFLPRDINGQDIGQCGGWDGELHCAQKLQGARELVRGEELVTAETWLSRLRLGMECLSNVLMLFTFCLFNEQMLHSWSDPVTRFR